MSIQPTIKTKDDKLEERIQEAYEAFTHARDSGYPHLAARLWCEVQRVMKQGASSDAREQEETKGF